MHKKTIVVFDDFYFGNKSLIKKFGCNKIINSLEKKYSVEFLEPRDYIPHLNTYVQLLKIKLK